MKNSIKKPNILFIITDDQGEWAVESEKNRDIKTPTEERVSHSYRVRYKHRKKYNENNKNDIF